MKHPQTPSSPEERRDQELETYWDGLLDPGQRAAFEERLSEDASLAADVALQGAIDASLRRVFSPPPHLEETAAALVARARLRPVRDGDVGRADRELETPAAGRLGWGGPLALAAGVLLVAWLVQRVVSDDGLGTVMPEGPVADVPRPGQLERLPGDAVYEQIVDIAAQFPADPVPVPLMSCVSPLEEPRPSFGIPITRGLDIRMDAGDSVQGPFSIAGSEPTRAVCSFTAASPDPVVLLVQESWVQAIPDVPPGSELNVFTLRAGEFVFHELSPLPTAVMLDRILPADEGGGHPGPWVDGGEAPPPLFELPVCGPSATRID